MNANSKPKVPIVSSWLGDATAALKAKEIITARLDAELLLSYVLNINRSWLIAHSTDKLNDNTFKQADALLQRRLHREPVAYLTGKKEFYGRNFIVTPDVLIPRPETEYLVEISLECLKKGSDKKIVDVGAGSGCVGITLKLERPELDVTLTDISNQALAVAKKNAEQLGAKVSYQQSDLLTAFSKIQNPKSKIYFDLIVANLPYVDSNWQRSPETNHEPALALFADDSGLKLVKQLIDQAQVTLKPGGNLVLEADPTQHSKITQYAKQRQLFHVETNNYGLRLRLLKQA